MNNWITNSRLCGMESIIDYEDIIFLPHQLGDICKDRYIPGKSHQNQLLSTLNHEVRRSYRSGVLAKILPQSNLLEWQDEVERGRIAHSRVAGTQMRNMSFLAELHGRYREAMMAKKKEPPWIPMLPKKIRADLRRHWHVIDYEDPEAIVPFLPFSDVRYLVREGGVCTESIRACALYRLGHIRPLGNLHDPAVFEEGFVAMGQRFNHSRYLHVNDVSALVTLMGLNNGIEHRLLKHLRVAALIHDALTPAHGDGTKAIDPALFDEDAFVATLLVGPNWEALKKKHGLSKTLLVDIVQHRHVLGVMLDYADRIAYVARDVDAYLLRYGKYTRVNATREYRMLSEIVRRNPSVCSLWDTIRLDEHGAVYCDDPVKLEQFLTVRILMFRGLYYNPHARFMEYFVSHAITSVLYEKGIVSHEELLRMGDMELDGIIGRALGDPYVMGMSGDFGEAHLKRFATCEEAAAFESCLKKNGISITLLDDVDRKIRSGTGYRVRNARGTIAPFRELCPHQAAALERLCVIPNPFAVYWIENNAMTDRIRKFMEAKT